MNEDIKNLFSSLKSDYDSGEGDDLGADFFTPCLKNCYEYDRATSDFTSNVIFEWGDAILKLVDIDNHQCKIRMIAHHKLHDDDLKILEEYLENEDEIEKYLEKISEGIFEEAIKLAEGHADRDSKLRMFAFLIASKRLEIKFAFPHHVRNPNVFHQKYGIFRFQNDDKIGFLGSPNETLGGHSRNIETIEVFNSTIPSDLNRINSWEKKFARSWKDEAKGFRTKEISKKTLERIISYSPRSANEFRKSRVISNENANTSNENKSNEIFKLWPHQQEAVDKFLKVEAGILEMATGTGKTKTSLEILKILAKEKKISSCIIVTKGNSLLEQWYSEIIEFLNSNDEIKKYLKKIYRQFFEYKEFEKFLSNPSNSILVISRENLQKNLRFISEDQKKDIFIIHDEVHGFGSPANIQKLKGSHVGFKYKLGMSATPDREYGEEGNQFIKSEIGNTFHKFGLEEAIQKKILCSMDYITQEYFLSEDEKAEMQNIRKKHYAKKKDGQKVSEEDLATKLAAVRKNAEDKIGKFRRYIESDPESIKNTIIFVYSKERGRQISQILDGKVKYSEYFEGDISETLLDFSEGKLECLIACHRLSEGIDIKGLKNIFLVASDRAKLETIQRIGRCLRKNPEDPRKKAKVVDFIDNDYDGDVERAEWLKNLSKIN
jgi:superfamily II DNA or RNA helicase